MRGGFNAPEGRLSRPRAAARARGPNLGWNQLPRTGLLVLLITALAPLALCQDFQFGEECRATINYGATVGDPDKVAAGQSADLPVFVGSFSILNHQPMPALKSAGNATNGGPQPGWVLSWRFQGGERIQVGCMAVAAAVRP